jgi:hypothetical protein
MKPDRTLMSVGPPLNWSVTVEPLPRSLEVFPLSAEVLRALEKAWSCSLSSEIVTGLELVCRATIHRRRIERAAVCPTRSELASAQKRHAEIVKVATRLLKLLEVDFYAPTAATLIGGGFAVKDFEQLSLLLVQARAEAQNPVLELRDLWARSTGKRGRPKTKDAWAGFMLSAAFYWLATGKKATAYYSPNKCKNESPFLRGLFILHSALPADVRLTSVDQLGDRVREILHPRKRPKKR